MPPRLTRPTNVPNAREPLVELLWSFYIVAGRPPARHVAAVIAAWDEEQRTGTANHETVRRTLRGEQIGAWQTVEMIFLALCEIADVDPADADDPDGYYDDRWAPPAHIERLRQCWNQAVDDSPMPNIPKTRKDRADERAKEQANSSARSARVSGYDDPWNSAGPPRSADDEPPF